MMRARFARASVAAATAVALSLSAAAAPAAFAQTAPSEADLEKAITELSTQADKLSSANGGASKSSEDASSKDSGSSSGEDSSINLPFNPLWLLLGGLGFVVVMDIIFSAINAGNYSTMFSPPR